MENIKKIFLIFAIAIIFFAFILYAKESIYPTPKYDNFCEARPVKPLINYSNMTECLEAGGEWVNSYCDLSQFNNECYEEYENAREKNDQYSFVIFFIVAIITIIVSLLFIKIGSVASGFLGGGILLLIYSLIRFWENFPDIVRTLILGIALIILVYIAYKKFNK
jgi:hypothetical protein